MQNLRQNRGIIHQNFVVRPVRRRQVLGKAIAVEPLVRAVLLPGIATGRRGRLSACKILMRHLLSDPGARPVVRVLIPASLKCAGQQRGVERFLRLERRGRLAVRDLFAVLLPGADKAASLGRVSPGAVAEPETVSQRKRLKTFREHRRRILKRRPVKMGEVQADQSAHVREHPAAVRIQAEICSGVLRTVQIQNVALCPGIDVRNVRLLRHTADRLVVPDAAGQCPVRIPIRGAVRAGHLLAIVVGPADTKIFADQLRSAVLAVRIVPPSDRAVRIAFHVIVEFLDMCHLTIRDALGRRPAAVTVHMAAGILMHMPQSHVHGGRSCRCIRGNH